MLGRTLSQKVTRFRRTFTTDIRDTNLSAISARNFSSEKSGFSQNHVVHQWSFFMPHPSMTVIITIIMGSRV